MTAKQGQRRRAAVAGQFYEGGSAALAQAVTEAIGEFKPPKLGLLVGGVVPHAGWIFSGATAAKVFATLAKQAAPATYLLFGAVHYPGIRGPSVYPAGEWETPLGPVSVNEKLASALVEKSGGLIRALPAAHASEHSIEVQLPFIRALSPDAMIVPVAVPPDEDAVEVGKIAAAVMAAQQENCVAVASSDLTHYGMGYGMPYSGPLPDALEWMHSNDRRIIQLALELRAEEIVNEAAERSNACGAGAIAAATAAARALGAKRGMLLEYTTSAEVMKETAADRAVGYAGIVFEK